MTLAGLAHERSELPGGQLFRYTGRVVPCCLDCNQFLSASLEAPVSQAVKSGFDSVRALPPPTMLLWMAKIYYGTRWRELGLRSDIKDASSQAMLARDELLASTDYLRQLLLSGPRHVAWNHPPGSLFLFRAGVPDDPREHFDFFVPNVGGALVALRIKDTLAIAVFGDSGRWESQLAETSRHQAAKALALHPAQCIELMLHVHTRVEAWDTSSSYTIMTTSRRDSDPALPGGASRMMMSSGAAEPVPSGVPQAQLDQAFVATFLRRAAQGDADERTLTDARQGRLPTLLVNAYDGEAVQAECFERTCPEVLLRAGWRFGGGTPCPRCGSPDA